VNARSHTDGDLTAELWVRADVPLGADDRQERLHDRAMGVDALADVEARLVPNRLSLSGVAAGTPVGAELRDAIVDARRWAADESVDVDPYLPTSEKSSIGDDRSRRVLTFPSVTLVEYRDGVVAGVTPHVDDGEVVSVEARLEALADAPGSDEVVAVES
jgi:hypothetical protein